MKNTINTDQYLAFIRDTLREEGLEIADTANKLALESQRITLNQYRLAARILADYILAR